MGQLVHNLNGQRHKYSVVVIATMQVLNTWLANSPNYDEVTQWYTGWKSLFDSELLAQPTVKGALPTLTVSCLGDKQCEKCEM